MEQKNKETFIVINEKGLHTRPSTELVKCAANYEAEINLTYQDLTVNAKSLLGILMLAAAKGAKIQIDATGPDASQAITAIRTLAENKFNVKY